jgi:hypothetical protein
VVAICEGLIWVGLACICAWLRFGPLQSQSSAAWA